MRIAPTVCRRAGGRLLVGTTAALAAAQGHRGRRNDDRSISELGVWPLRRLRHAQAVDRLRRTGAREIVDDVQFTEASPRPDDDLALYDAIGRAGGATLATSTSDARGHTDVLSGDTLLARIASRAAATALHGNPLRDAPTWLTFAAIALLGLAVPLASLRLRPLLTLALVGALAAGTVIAAQVAFAHGIVVAVAAPLLALGLGTLGAFVADYALEARQRRRASAYGEALEQEVAARTHELRATQL